MRLSVMWLLAALLTSTPALAELRFALDGDVAIPVGEGLDTAETGLHFGGRLGYALPLPTIDLVFEIQGSRLSFSSALAEEKDGYNGFGVGAGVRLGMMFADLRAAISTHAGYGLIEVVGSDYVGLDHGLLLDADAALTYLGWPLFGVGMHGGYHSLIDASHPNPSLPRTDDWIAIGLHVEFRL